MGSKEFDMIKKIVDSHREVLDLPNQLERQRIQMEKDRLEQVRLNNQAKIDADKIILKNSGVIELFEEIRDSGLVRANDNKSVKFVSVIKKGLFGIKYEETDKILLDFKPAVISNIDDCDTNKSRWNNNLVYVSLMFDIYPTGDRDNPDLHAKEIRIGVIDGKICLLREDSGIPIEPGKLAETVAEAIKNPPIKY